MVYLCASEKKQRSAKVAMINWKSLKSYFLKVETETEIQVRVDALPLEDFQRMSIVWLAIPAQHDLSAFYESGIPTPNSLTFLAIARRMAKEFNLPFEDQEKWVTDARQSALDRSNETKVARETTQEFDI
jgi:hypothetical protein